jgi:hypothetical protein
MTHIENTRELPWCELRHYLVKDEAEAVAIAGDNKSYLFQQTAEALYLFVVIPPKGA